MSYEDQNIDVGEQGRTHFDFRGFLFKALNLWKLVFICIGLSLVVAYFINVRKENIYKLNSLISIESDQNPFFTANTSISFNWGGVSGKVGKIMTSINTRRHNEKVVDSLEFYMRYLVQGKYRKIDIYKKAPFIYDINKLKAQALNKDIGIRAINTNEFEIFTEFTGPSVQVQRYNDMAKYNANVPVGEFKKRFKYGDTINLPFLNGVIKMKAGLRIKPNSEYFIRFSNFDNIVYTYQKAVKINPSNRSSSVLQLSLIGNNKAKIADYLNATADILSRTELERKNLYATNTIRFIDSSLRVVDGNLKDVTDQMNDFRKQNKVFDINEELIQVSEKLKTFDLKKEEENSKLEYSLRR